MRKIVAIDGPAGSGKSTIAKHLAARVGFQHLDTGALYRAYTWALLKKGIAAKDAAKSVKEIKLQWQNGQVLVNGEQPGDAIRSEEISKEVPNFAKIPELRQEVKELQQRIGENGGIVIDGRDIGTEVFPDAFCKFYLDAKPEVRAERRLKDLGPKAGKNAADVKRELIARDEADRTRKISPLRLAPDAHTIDTTNKSVDQVLELMAAHFKRCEQKASGGGRTVDADQSRLFQEAMEGVDHQIVRSTTVEPGTFLKGRVLRVTDKEAVLDIDQKRDGLIPAEEIAQLEPGSLKPGDIIDVYVKNVRPAAHIIVSKLEADKRASLIKLKEIYEHGESVHGIVKEAIKGGFLIDLMGTLAFCPFSEYDLRRVNKEDVEIGTPVEVSLIEFRDKERFVVSRRRVLEHKYELAASSFFEHAQPGDIVEGRVVNITEFGAFVDIGDGITAILRPRNASWKRIHKVDEVLKKGDPIKAKVIYVDPGSRKVEVSKRELDTDPFVDFYAQHPVGSELDGTVRHLEEFGAFVEVADGVEGLLHISEISHTKRYTHAKEAFEVGHTIRVKLINIDLGQRRISLSQKQAADNPWENLEGKYPEGVLVQTVIRDVSKNGVYTTVDGEYEGFIHISDVSWGADKGAIEQQFVVGETIEAKVISVNRAKRRLDLGLKQKTANPYDDLVKNYGEGGSIEGEVVRVSENGAFVKLSEEIEGFCHISQLGRDRVEKAEDAVKVGSKYRFLLQTIDEKTKKVSLSIKGLLDKEEKEAASKFSGGDRPFTIEDFVKR